MIQIPLSLKNLKVDHVIFHKGSAKYLALYMYHVYDSNTCHDGFILRYYLHFTLAI